MRTALRFLAAAVLAVTGISCGDVVRQGGSPVFLVIERLEAAPGNEPDDLGVPLQSDVLTTVTSPAPCSQTTPCHSIFNDVGQAVLRIEPKDISIAPTSNNSVTITRYRVVYRRTDGRNVQGRDVPYAFDGAATATISPGVSVALPFEVVRHAAKMESPLAQLVTNPEVITTIAEITFFGQDLVGNEISVTGLLHIDFGNFGN